MQKGLYYIEPYMSVDHGAKTSKEIKDVMILHENGQDFATMLLHTCQTPENAYRDAIVRLIDPAISIHDFRMVSGPTHTNVIFDAVVPYNCVLADRDVAQRIQSGVRALDGNYFAVVRIEKGYV